MGMTEPTTEAERLLLQWPMASGPASVFLEELRAYRDAAIAEARADALRGAAERVTPVALPTLAEVRVWDREHRQECQERHCTLDHRMLAFADWYIVIEHGYRERIEAEARAEALDVERLASIILDGGLRLPDFDHWRESRSNKPSDPDDERWVCVCGVAGSPEFVQRHWAAMRAEYARLAREGSDE
jgi:hypothetical protein